MPFLERSLVDAQRVNRLNLTTAHTAFNCAATHRINLAPAQAKPFRNCRDARFLEPAYHKTFKERREPGALIRPVYTGSVYTMIRAGNSWHIGFNDRLQLTCIQVPPPAHSMVMSHTFTFTVGAFESSLRFMVNLDRDSTSLEVDRNISDVPRFDNTKNPFVQGFIIHALKINSVRYPPFFRMRLFFLLDLHGTS
jgi:hypothetical protein